MYNFIHYHKTVGGIDMKCEFYNDINSFAKDVLPLVTQYETQNNLLLGNINRELQGGNSNNLKIVIKDDSDEVILVGVQVDPFNLTLAEKNNKPYDDAIQLLVQTLYEKQIEIPGCIAVEGLADRFSTIYLKYFKKKLQTKFELNLLQAKTITPPHKAKGYLRVATESDLFYLPYWLEAFALECGLLADTIENNFKKLSSHIEKKTLYIWEDEKPVSVCMQGRHGEKGAAISFVYTPPYYRGKGYASECVAYASQAILEKGFEHCYLFADKANPISNKIYIHIGYEMVSLTKSICFIN